MKYRKVLPRRIELDDLGPIQHSTRRIDANFKKIKEKMHFLLNDSNLENEFYKKSFLIKTVNDKNMIKDHIKQIFKDEHSKCNRFLSTWEIFLSFIDGTHPLIKKEIEKNNREGGPYNDIYLSYFKNIFSIDTLGYPISDYEQQMNILGENNQYEADV